jgi:phosphate-selective porin OprO and OprP
MTKLIINKSHSASRRFSVWKAGPVGVALIGLAGLTGANAEDDLAALRKQLKALESKVAALETSQSSVVSAREAELRKKLETLPDITLDSGGLQLKSPGRVAQRTTTGADGKTTTETVEIQQGDDYKFKLGVLLQPQGRFFINTPDTASTFLMRRARLNLEGTVWRYFDWKLQTDLQASGVNNSTSTTVQDAYLGAKAADWLQLRIGKQKSPIGIERWQSAHARWFTDTITTTYIVPNRTIGAMLWGRVGDGLAEYYTGIFNGEPDGGSSNFSAPNQNTKEFQARLALTPLAKTGIAPLEKLSLGAGVTYAPELNGLGTYATANQQSFFRYNAATIAATNENPGEQVRFVPNASWFWGPFGLYGEAAWSTTGVTNGAASDNLTNFGWQVAASYFLTGENNSLRAVKPKRPFSPSNGQWGALQVAARAGQVYIDPDTFPTYANPDTQSERSTTFGVAVNWLLNENVKLSLGYDYTSFLGGAPSGGNRPDSNAITSQFQLYF